MRLIRVVVAGVVVTAFAAGFGMLTCGWLFTWVYELEPTSVWKQMDMPPMEFLIGSLILAFVLAAFYELLKKSIPGRGFIAKGLMYGFFVWAVGVLPGMLATHTFMTVATEAVIYLTVRGLAVGLIEGALIAAICGSGSKASAPRPVTG